MAQPLLSRELPSYNNETAHQCRCRKCPVYKAPPCFSKCLGELLSSVSCYGTGYPDWKQFTRYFDIRIAVSEEGAVTYWVYDHKDRDQHTIQCILDFAENEGHSPLRNQFEKLIEGILLFTVLTYTKLLSVIHSSSAE